MAKISNIPEKIFNFFTEKAEKLGKESGFKKRQSKLTPTAFVKALLKSSLSQQFSLELFCGILNKLGIKITKQAIFLRFNKHTVLFVKLLITESLKYFKTEQLPQGHLLEQFTAVNLIDSTTTSLKSVLSEFFKGSGGAASSAAVKIQTMFDSLNGQIKELVLTAGRANDQGFDIFLNKIEQGALYLMDLGYFKLGSFKKILDGKAFFISRLLTGTSLLTLEGTPIELVITLSNSPSIFSQQVLMGAKAKIPVRLITQRLPQALAEQRRRQLKAGHRRRGITPCKESLALQDWSIYITNTTQAQIPDNQIHATYAGRWQIELLFKLSKSLVHIDSINTTQYHRVIIELYGKFMGIILLFFISAPVRYPTQGKELSFYKACKLLIDEAYSFILALSSIYRLNKFLCSFWTDLARFATKDLKKKPLEQLHPFTPQTEPDF